LNDSGDTIATAEIISLADCDAPENWVADRLIYLAEKGEKTLWKEKGEDAHPIIALIAELRTTLPLLAPREALQTVITRCDLARKVLQWKPDAGIARQRLSNLEALLDMADKYEDSCRNNQQAATISGLILWLNEQAVDEQDSLALPGLDAVRVMTHHAAKGLEWPIVILTDLHKENRDRLWSTTAMARSGIDAHNPLKDRFIHFWPWPFGKQSSGISVSTAITLSDTGQQFIREAKEEAKRLLYVSMTRARDLLIFALGVKDKSREWLDTVAPDWLVTEDVKATKLTLPSGKTIGYEHWLLEVDPEQPQNKPEDIHAPLQWFSTPAATIRVSLNYLASGAKPIPCKVLEKISIGARITITNTPDMSVLGTALHACIGTSFTDANCPMTIDEYSAILAGYDVLEHIKPEDAQRQTEALHDWIKNRWVNAKVLAEVPIETKSPNGQIMNGRIDLLVETSGGWILIDHKSSQHSANQWDTLAVEYSGQLAAYGEAICRTSGKPVLENWLYLPVAGGAVKVDLFPT
jgi:ATP-dependent exoDNAse (exonuclease V) beta subunit